MEAKKSFRKQAVLTIDKMFAAASLLMQLSQERNYINWKLMVSRNVYR